VRLTGTRDKADGAREERRRAQRLQGARTHGRRDTVSTAGRLAAARPRPTKSRHQQGGTDERKRPEFAGADVPGSTGESLEQSVFRSLEQYFDNLDGAKPHALHEMVLGAIEKPLLQFALHRCAGNQSAAADLLGINRNTLRRKLQDYGLHGRLIGGRGPR
jgi:Fis family transcriptional regulator, factor for inversion stimulation protein